MLMFVVFLITKIHFQRMQKCHLGTELNWDYKNWPMKNTSLTIFIIVCRIFPELNIGRNFAVKKMVKVATVFYIKRFLLDTHLESSFWENCMTSPTNALAQVCWKLPKWFLRICQKCKGFTDGQTERWPTGKDDDLKSSRTFSAGEVWAKNQISSTTMPNLKSKI